MSNIESTTYFAEVVNDEDVRATMTCGMCGDDDMISTVIFGAKNTNNANDVSAKEDGKFVLCHTCGGAMLRMILAVASEDVVYKVLAESDMFDAENLKMAMLGTFLGMPGPTISFQGFDA